MHSVSRYPDNIYLLNSQDTVDLYRRRGQKYFGFKITNPNRKPRFFFIYCFNKKVLRSVWCWKLRLHIAWITMTVTLLYQEYGMTLELCSIPFPRDVPCTNMYIFVTVTSGPHCMSITNAHVIHAYKTDHHMKTCYLRATPNTLMMGWTILLWCLQYTCSEWFPLYRVAPTQQSSFATRYHSVCTKQVCLRIFCEDANNAEWINSLALAYMFYSMCQTICSQTLFKSLLMSIDTSRVLMKKNTLVIGPP